MHKKFLQLCTNDRIIRIVKKKKNNRAFVDHPMYTNGLILEFYQKKKIPIYSLGYPKGILLFSQKKKN